jgi:hypothetical protein
MELDKLEVQQQAEHLLGYGLTGISIAGMALAAALFVIVIVGWSGILQKCLPTYEVDWQCVAAQLCMFLGAFCTSASSYFGVTLRISGGGPIPSQADDDKCGFIWRFSATGYLFNQFASFVFMLQRMEKVRITKNQARSPLETFAVYLLYASFFFMPPLLIPIHGFFRTQWGPADVAPKYCLVFVPWYSSTAMTVLNFLYSCLMLYLFIKPLYEHIRSFQATSRAGDRNSAGHDLLLVMKRNTISCALTVLSTLVTMTIMSTSYSTSNLTNQAVATYGANFDPAVNCLAVLYNTHRGWKWNKKQTPNVLPKAEGTPKS